MPVEKEYLDPRQRAEEKEASRRRDQEAFESGRMSAEDVLNKNAVVSDDSIKDVKINI